MTTTTLGTRLLQFGALGCAFTISACLVIREQKRANPEEAATNPEEGQSGVISGTPENVALYSSKGLADTNLAADGNPVYILGSKSLALPDDYLVDENGHPVTVYDSQPPPEEFLFSSKSAAIEIVEEDPTQNDIYLRSSKWGSIELTEPEESIPALSSQTRPPAPTDQVLLPSSKSFVMNGAIGEPQQSAVGQTEAPGSGRPAYIASSKSVVIGLPAEVGMGTPSTEPLPQSASQENRPYKVVAVEELEKRARELEDLRQRVAELEAQIAALLAAQQDD